MMLILLLMQFQVVDGAKTLNQNDFCSKKISLVKGMMDVRNAELKLMRTYKVEDEERFKKAIISKSHSEMMVWTYIDDELMVFIDPSTTFSKAVRINGKNFHQFSRVMFLKFFKDKACLYIFRGR